MLYTKNHLQKKKKKNHKNKTAVKQLKSRQCTCDLSFEHVHNNIIQIYMVTRCNIGVKQHMPSLAGPAAE